ncbi:MAG: PadR family transcriptional regulator [Candidatus Hermodarchaeota archaeon]
MLLDERLERELVSNLLAYLVLKCVEVHNGKSYGYQMKQFIEKLLNKEVAEGTLYPLLAKLADENKYGCLESFIEQGSNRPRRYYTLTEKGRNQLAIWPRRWEELVTMVMDVLNQVGGLAEA